MRKRAFFIHGWGGSPEEAWRPWLRERLEEKEFIVINLSMPNTDYPQMNEWVEVLNDAVGTPDKNCYFVGHSLGCITILRFLENLPQSKKVGGALLIAAFTDDLKIEEIKNFFTKNINWEKIKKHCDNFTVILSDNDSYVPLFYRDIFREKLKAKIIIEHNSGHFSKADGTKELPVALREILQLVEV